MHEKEKVVIFDEMQDIRDFVNAAEACDFDIDVYGNRAVVDAKSILGMLGFGLKRAFVSAIMDGMRTLRILLLNLLLHNTIVSGERDALLLMGAGQFFYFIGKFCCAEKQSRAREEDRNWTIQRSGNFILRCVTL